MTEITDGDQNVEVYLGTPILHYAVSKDEDRDPYFSKVGGRPAWLRPVRGYVQKSGKQHIDKRNTVVCPECSDSSYLRLLAQLHCPLSVFDRVLYLFMCVNCSDLGSSSVFCVRSQLFNEDYARELAAVEAKALSKKEYKKEHDVKGPMFAVDDEDADWGQPSTVPSEEQESHNTLISEPSPVAQTQIYTKYQESTKSDLSAFNSCTPLAALPVISINTILEPPPPKIKNIKSSGTERISQQLIKESGEKQLGCTDPDDDASPEGTADEIQQEEYISRLSRYPSQTVRWAPNGTPVHSTHSRRPPLSTSVPQCSECGAFRVFEFQLLSPTIYFFQQKEKQAMDSKESDHKRKHIDEIKKGRKEDPRFSTISVYTCSSHCYSQESTISYEYCHVEPDL